MYGETQCAEAISQYCLSKEPLCPRTRAYRNCIQNEERWMNLKYLLVVLMLVMTKDGTTCKHAMRVNTSKHHVYMPENENDEKILCVRVVRAPFVSLRRLESSATMVTIG